jgi:hypothetical protein
MKLGLMFVGLALAVLLSMPGAMAAYNDLTGTVLSISSEGVATVNIASSNTLGITGVSTILLSDQATAAALQNYIGKELTFEILGYDILGRFVCEAYQNGVPIDYVPVKLPPKKPLDLKPKPDSHPAANGDKPPADGTQPPADDGTKPADGTKPPANDGSKPVDGTQPGNGAGTPPADGTEPPANGGANGGTPPSDDIQPPANGSSPQTGNTSPST